MLEALSDVDENIMEKFLGGQEIGEEEIKAALRKGHCSVEADACYMRHCL